MRTVKWWAVMIMIGLAMALNWPAPAKAARFEGGETYHLGASETVDGNVYAAGETVRIDGTVHGDVVAAGRTVELGPTAVVDGDVWGAAQAVVVRGRIAGDLRGAGYVVRLDNGGVIGGEMLAAGYSIELGPSSVLSGELSAAGYQGILDGTTNGAVNFAGSGMEITGRALGDLDLDLQGTGDDLSSRMFGTNGRSADRPVAGGLSVGELAQLEGNLRYTAVKQAALPASWEARSQFSESVRPERGDAAARAVASPSPFGTWLRNALGIWLGLVLVAVLAWQLFPAWTNRVAEVVATQLLASMGVGALVGVGAIAGLVALIVAVIMALVFVGSIGLSALIGPILALTTVLAVALTAGVYLLGWVGTVAVAVAMTRFAARRAGELTARAWPLALALLIVALLVSLPQAGPWLRLVVTLLGLGAIALASRSTRSPLSPGPAPAVN